MNSTVDFLNNPWKPVRNRIIRSSALADKILSDGFAVLDIASNEQLELLQNLYENEHKVAAENGGMFYSLYSQNIDYRWRIHNSISKILKPTLDEYFQAYKEVVNTFITKFPGPKSEFFIHQDTTGLDEFRFSPLSIWIPLEDVTKESGAMSLLPKSHHFFTPYRGISFGYPFDKIKNEVAKYLKPIELKRGQAIVFDPRVVHNSAANTTSKPRIVSLTGLFPKEAVFRHCYLDKTTQSSVLEIYEQDENFLIEYPHLLIDCTERPNRGRLVQKTAYSVPEMTLEVFEELCNRHQVSKFSTEEVSFREDCVMIGEPI